MRIAPFAISIVLVAVLSSSLAGCVTPAQLAQAHTDLVATLDASVEQIDASIQTLDERRAKIDGRLASIHEQMEDLEDSVGEEGPTEEQSEILLALERARAEVRAAADDLEADRAGAEKFRAWIDSTRAATSEAMNESGQITPQGGAAVGRAVGGMFGVQGELLFGLIGAGVAGLGGVFARQKKSNEAKRTMRALATKVAGIDRVFESLPPDQHETVRAALRAAKNADPSTHVE